MFGTLGGQEILLILVIALIVFGPRKLPEIGKTVGKMLAEFRKASSDFKRTIEDEVEAEKVLPPPALAAVGATEPVIEPVAVPPDTPTVSRAEAEGVEPPAAMETPSRVEPPEPPETPEVREPVETKQA
jgi:sec-independent protein translocase protein TatA